MTKAYVIIFNFLICTSFGARRMSDRIYSFFISIAFFKVSLSMLTKLLISALFYAYNMRTKIEYVVSVLGSKGSPHYLTWKFKQSGLICIIIRTCVYVIKKTLDLILISHLSPNIFSYFRAYYAYFMSTFQKISAHIGLLRLCL